MAVRKVQGTAWRSQAQAQALLGAPEQDQLQCQAQELASWQRLGPGTPLGLPWPAGLRLAQMSETLQGRLQAQPPGQPAAQACIGASHDDGSCSASDGQQPVSCGRRGW